MGIDDDDRPEWAERLEKEMTDLASELTQALADLAAADDAAGTRVAASIKDLTDQLAAANALTPAVQSAITAIATETQKIANIDAPPAPPVTP